MFHHQLVEIWLHTLWPLSQVFVYIGFQFCWVDFGLLDYITTVFSSLRKCQAVFPAAAAASTSRCDCMCHSHQTGPRCWDPQPCGDWCYSSLVANEKTLRPRWLETLCSKAWQLSGACLLVGARALLLSPALCLPLVSAHSSFLTYLSFVILHSRSLLYSLRFLPWPLSGIFQLSSHCWFSCCHQGGSTTTAFVPIPALVQLQLASCFFTTRSTDDKDKSRPRTWWERHLIKRAAQMGVSWPPWRVGCWQQG